MKTKLTGSDLLFIFNVLQFELRIANNTKEHKEECKRIMQEISNSLGKLKIEIKDK